MLSRQFLVKAAAALFGAGVLWSPLVAYAQDGGGTKTAQELRADYDKAVKGKTIAYLPIALPRRFRLNGAA